MMVKTLTRIRLIVVLGIVVGGTIAQSSAQDLSRVQWVEEATLTRPNGTVNDDFGSAVDIDANTVVVGAPRAAVGGNTAQGTAFVRIRFFGIWWPIAELNASGGAAGDWFGFSVAIADDTIVVGAPRADVDGKSDQGAAYVFTQTGITWTQTATLAASTGAAGDLFGNAVAIDGHTIVVGAESAAQGKAHVFTDAGGVWTEAATLAAVNPEGPFFGKSVAIDGETIVVGAWGHSGGAGAAFVFTRTGSEWTETAELSGQTNAFGWSVAIFGNTVVVGATDFDLGTVQRVAQPAEYGPPGGFGPKAYVFTQTGGAWTEAARLVAPSGWQADAFGESVAMYGDRVVVGASGAILIEEDRTTGAAFLYNRSGNTWTEAATLARGGRSVATAGNTVVTGGSRAAYVFVRKLLSS